MDKKKRKMVKKESIHDAVGAAIEYFKGAWEREERRRQRAERNPAPGTENELAPPDTPSSKAFSMQNELDSRRQALWDAIQRALKPENVSKLRTLSELQRRGLTWARIEEELNRLVRDPSWQILNDTDLLPGVTLDDVRRAFKGMKLTKVNLRKFSSRTWQELHRLFGCS